MASGNGIDPGRVSGGRLDRRRLLKGVAAGATALAASIPSVMRPGHTVAATTTLNVLALQWPQAPAEQELATQRFAKQTGIAVNITQTNYGFMEQRIQQLVEVDSDEYDIYHYDSQWIGGLVARGALDRLDTPAYLGSPAATVKFDDFFPELSYRLAKYPAPEAELAAGNFAAAAAAPVYGLPWSLNAQALWYRTDLVSRPPETWDELREMAKGLTKDGTYGMTFQGSRNADYVTCDFTAVMLSFGGRFWDPATYTAEGHINNLGAVEALRFMRQMVADDKSVDPASGGWGFDERLAAILQGKTAMALCWVPLLGGIADDPATSTVAGKIAFAPSPKGSAGQAATYGCQGSGINGFAKHKAEAWQYLQWLTSKETQQALMDVPTAGFLSARKDLKDATKYPWQDVLVSQIPIVRDFWNVPEYAQLLTSLQMELNLGYVGRKTPEEALDSAAIIHQAILDESPDNPATAAS